jgi:hypothetical protein
MAKPTMPLLPSPHLDTHGPLLYPQFVVAGVSLRPNEKWNLQLDIAWADLDRVNDIAFTGTTYGDSRLPRNREISVRTARSFGR